MGRKNRRGIKKQTKKDDPSVKATTVGLQNSVKTSKVLRKRRRLVAHRAEKDADKIKKAATLLPFKAAPSVMPLLKIEPLVRMMHMLKAGRDDDKSFYRCKLIFGTEQMADTFTPFVDSTFHDFIAARIAHQNSLWQSATTRPIPLITSEFKNTDGETVSMETMFNASMPFVVSDMFVQQEVTHVQLKFWHNHTWFPTAARLVLYLVTRLDNSKHTMPTLEPNSVRINRAIAAQSSQWRYRTMQSWTGRDIKSASICRMSMPGAHTVELELQEHEDYFKSTEAHTPLFATASFLTKMMDLMLGAVDNGESLRVTMHQPKKEKGVGHELEL